MTYHSPGIEYFCPGCNSNKIGFIFDEKYKEWLDTMRAISARKIKLSNSYRDYRANPNSMKWKCYRCNDCGVVQKSSQNRGWFARCKEEGKLNQFRDFIEEKGTKLMQEISSIHSEIGTVYKHGVTLFNQEFKEHDEALEGEPVLGVCTTCLDSWFNQENVKKYKPRLDSFNSNMYNYREEVWTRKNLRD